MIEQINAKGTRIIKTNCWCARYEFGNFAHMNQYWVFDGDTTVNRLEKLEEKDLHKYRVSGIARGERAGKAKLKSSDIPIIRQLLAEGKLLRREIGKMFGVRRGAIRDIQFGKTWAHI